MSHFQVTDFNEPYSSVSFQHKQPTSPYPYNNNNNNNEIFPNKIQISRWLRIHRKTILLLTSFILFILYLLRDSIFTYLYFVKIKMDNTMFDRGYVSCGSLRKDPMLFIQDTHHVQVVWEMNCGMKTKEMTLTYWSEDNIIHTVGPVEPTVLDPYHTVYKATIGPLDHKRITYAIHSQISSKKKKQITKYAFDWFSEIDNEPIRIAAMADNQFGMLTFSSLLRQIKKFPKRKQPHFLLHAGDAVQNYPSLRQWQTDFTAPLAIHGLSQRLPMIYAHGNHDFDAMGEYTYTRSSDPWFAFSMAKGAVRFIVLDSNVDWELQDTWLRNEIKTSAFQEAQFRIVVVHVPPFLEYWDPEAWFQLGQSEWGAFIKDRYVPLFEEGGVDLVISGHQHNYERGERNGIHYAIIGGAGGDIDFDQVKDWGMYEAKLLDFHFVMIEITPPEPGEDDNAWTLQWDTFDIKGRNVDSVLITSHAKTLRQINIL